MYTKLCDWENGVGLYRMFFLGRSVMSDLLCTIKSKEINTGLKTFTT